MTINYIFWQIYDENHLIRWRERTATT